MGALNRVFLIGNLTREPDTRYTPGGKAVGDLRLAVSRKFKTADGQERDETCFVSVVVWGRQAETCQEFLGKGSSVMVEGRLQYEEWEKDGQKSNRLRVVAERVQFLGKPRSVAPGEEGGVKAGRDDAGRREESMADPAASPAAPDGGGDTDNLPF